MCSREAKSHKLTVVRSSDGKFCLVSGVQHAMLTFVQEHREALYREISEGVGLDRPTVTTYAGRMEKAKLVRRSRLKINGIQYATLTLEPGVVLNLDVVRI